MKLNQNAIITEARCRNRLVLLRKRLRRKQVYLNNNPHLDPRKIERKQKSILRDIKEMDVMVGWMDKARRTGGFAYTGQQTKNGVGR